MADASVGEVGGAVEPLDEPAGAEVGHPAGVAALPKEEGPNATVRLVGAMGGVLGGLIGDASGESECVEALRRSAESIPAAADASAGAPEGLLAVVDGEPAGMLTPLKAAVGAWTDANDPAWPPAAAWTA